MFSSEASCMMLDKGQRFYCQCVTKYQNTYKGSHVLSTTEKKEHLPVHFGFHMKY